MNLTICSIMTDSLKRQTRAFYLVGLLPVISHSLGHLWSCYFRYCYLLTYCTATEMLRLCKVMLAHNKWTLVHFAQNQQHERLYLTFEQERRSEQPIFTFTCLPHTFYVFTAKIIEMIQNELLNSTQINTHNNNKWDLFNNYSKEVKTITTVTSSHPS